MAILKGPLEQLLVQREKRASYIKEVLFSSFESSIRLMALGITVIKQMSVFVQKNNKTFNGNDYIDIVQVNKII